MHRICGFKENSGGKDGWGAAWPKLGFHPRKEDGGQDDPGQTKDQVNKARMRNTFFHIQDNLKKKLVLWIFVQCVNFNMENRYISPFFCH